MLLERIKIGVGSAAGINSTAYIEVVFMSMNTSHMPSNSFEQQMYTSIRKEFMKSFSFEKNVGLCQKYHDEWEDFVEIDDGEIIGHKEKMKVVVMPILGTPADSNENEVSQTSLQIKGSSCRKGIKYFFV